MADETTATTAVETETAPITVPRDIELTPVTAAPAETGHITANIRAERVYNLNVELMQMEQQKKASNRAFTDEIKRIKGEIKDILDNTETTETEAPTDE